MNNIYENKLKKEYKGGRYLFFASSTEKELEKKLILEKNILKNYKQPLIEIETKQKQTNESIITIEKNIQNLSKQIIEVNDILELFKFYNKYIINKKIEKVFEEELNKANEEKAKIQDEKEVFILFDELTIINKAKDKAQVLYQKAITDNVEEDILLKEKQFNILTKQYNLLNKKYLLVLGQKQELKQKEKQKHEIEQVHEHDTLIKILTQIKENVITKKIKYKKKLVELINNNKKIEKIFQEIKENKELHHLKRMLNDKQKMYNNINNEIASEQKKCKELNEKYSKLEIIYKDVNDKYLEQENIVNEILNKIKNTYF